MSSPKLSQKFLSGIIASSLVFSAFGAITAPLASAAATATPAVADSLPITDYDFSSDVPAQPASIFSKNFPLSFLENPLVFDLSVGSGSVSINLNQNYSDRQAVADDINSQINGSVGTAGRVTATVENGSQIKLTTTETGANVSLNLGPTPTVYDLFYYADATGIDAKHPKEFSITDKDGDTAKIFLNKTFDTLADVAEYITSAMQSHNVDIQASVQSGNVIELTTANNEGLITGANAQISLGGPDRASLFSLATYSGTDADPVTAVSMAPLIEPTGLNTGDSGEIRANVTMSDNSVVNVATDASTVWTTSNPAVARVDNTGSVIAVGAGTATLTVTYNGLSQSVNVTVGKSTAQRLAEDVANIQIGYQGLDNSNRVTQNITLPTTGANGSTISWDNGGLGVYITNTGIINRTMLDIPATLTATVVNGGQTATRQFIVMIRGIMYPVPTISKIYPSRETATVPAGNSDITITASAWLSDSSTLDITTRGTWTSSNPSIVTVSQNGVLHFGLVGTATVSFIYDNYSFNIPVQVGVPTQTGVTVNVSEADLAVGSTKTATVNQVLSDSTQVPIPGFLATWTTDNPAVATVSNGVVTGVSAGLTLIHVSFNGFSAQFNVNVVGGQQQHTLDHLSANTLNVPIQIGTPAGLPVITATYTDLTHQVLEPADIVWSFVPTGVADIIHRELVGLNVGTTVLKATYGGQFIQIPISVTAQPQVPTITSLELSQENAAMNIGGYVDVTARAHYSDNSMQNVPQSEILWTSSNPAVATVSSTGHVVGVSDGTTVIKATYQGQSATVNVSIEHYVPTVTLLTANQTVTVEVGHQAPLNIVAHMSDDTTVLADLTASLSSANDKVAGYLNGQVLGLAVGTTTITATLQGKSATINVTVIPVQEHNHGGDGSPPTEPTKPTEPVTKPTEPVTKPTEPVTKPKDIFNSDVVKTDKNVLAVIKQQIEEHKANTTPTPEPSDIKGHWAEKTVDTFVKLHIIQGYEDGTAKPDAPITRAEFASIITRVFAISSGTNNADLNDISNHWAKQAIEALAKAGVIGGYGDGSFQPDKTISREEMAIILSRVINLNAIDKDESKGAFGDVEGSFAATAITQLAQAGVVSGKGNAEFDPKADSSRAEALQIILNALNLNPDIKTLFDSFN